MSVEISITDQIVEINETSTPVEIYVSAGASSSAVWGGITGTLSSQTDLQNALNAKYNNPTGTAAQYIRGDGQLANFPDNQGGGSSVNYYLNGSVTQGTFGGTTYYEMSKTPVLGAGTNFTRTNAQGNGYIASFITDAGDPSLLNIPSGNWNVEFYFQANSNAGNPQFYAELYKVDASNNFTLVGSGSTNPEGITNGTTIDQYYTAIPVPQTSLLVTDRLAIRIFVITSGRTITLHTENSNLCEVLTTLSTGLNALNGLTAQVQYFATGTSGTDFAISSATDTHTFNLPTASATNRGALSSADWTTFNNKQNALTNPITGTGTSGQVAYFTGATTQAGSNNLFWDATNNRLGIGTASPSNLGAITIAGNIIVRPNGTAGVPVETSLRFFGASDAASGASITTVDQSSYNVGLGFFTRSGGTVSEKLRIFNNGNISLQNGGTFTDSGQRLQVTGEAIITSATTPQLRIDYPSGGSLRISALSTANSFSLLDSQGYGFTHGTSSSGINARQTNISIWTQAVDTTTLQLGGQDTNPTLARTRTHIQPVANPTTAFAPTSGTAIDYNFRTTGNSNFAPTSGTATYTQVQFAPVINQTGGANGITRGLLINPTLTAAADFRAIEVSAGVTVLAPSVTARASLRIPSGTAPTSPVNGDIWFDGTNLQMRIGGVTRTFTLI
jgi:hypothetical protein